MKGQLHFISSEDPIILWGETMKSLCGKEIEEAHPVMQVDLQDASLRAPASTFRFCRVCWNLAFAPILGIRYVYGIAPAQEVFDELQ